MSFFDDEDTSPRQREKERRRQVRVEREHRLSKQYRRDHAKLITKFAAASIGVIALNLLILAAAVAVVVGVLILFGVL
jgi:hypothetical protein